MFETTTLRAKDGDVVCQVTIPRFRPKMDALLWGERVFGRGYDGDYYEMSFFVVLPGWDYAKDEGSLPAQGAGLSRDYWS